MKKLFILFISVTLTSCFNERIELDLNEDNPQLVFTGWINDIDEDQFVQLRWTSNYLGNDEQENATGAVITLSDESSTYALSENAPGKYYLPLDWQAQPGDWYTIDIDFDGNQYSASHLMRPCPEIEDLELLQVEPDSNEVVFETSFAFQEPAGEGDAFYLIDYLKGTAEGDSLKNGFFADDEFYEEQYIEDITITRNYFEIGDTAVIELYSVGLETSSFLADIESEVFRGGPFDPPPSNVRTNLTGGAIGYFIISGAQRVEIAVE